MKKVNILSTVALATMLLAAYGVPTLAAPAPDSVQMDGTTTVVIKNHGGDSGDTGKDTGGDTYDFQLNQVPSFNFPEFKLGTQTPGQYDGVYSFGHLDTDGTKPFMITDTRGVGNGYTVSARANYMSLEGDSLQIAKINFKLANSANPYLMANGNPMIEGDTDYTSILDNDAIIANGAPLTNCRATSGKAHAEIVFGNLAGDGLGTYTGTITYTLAQKV
jgi:hypothetical protein